MSYETERQDITQAFKTAWEAGSNLPVKYFNSEFTPPANGSPWVTFTIIRGQSRAVGIVGNNQVRYRHPGVVQIDISIAQKKGSRIALLLADEIAAIFRGKTISGIRFFAPELTEVTEEQTSRTKFIVSIAFHRDQNH